MMANKFIVALVAYGKGLARSINRKLPEFLLGVKENDSFFTVSRDRILWILANKGGMMERSRLRAATGMRHALLNPLMEELARAGKITITAEKHGELISPKE